MEDEQRSWLDDLFESYGAVRLGVIGLLGPVLVMSELLQGRLALGVGLGFVCLMVWTRLAVRLGVAGQALERFGNVSLTIGGLILAWHYLRWWIQFLT